MVAKLAYQVMLIIHGRLITPFFSGVHVCWSEHSDSSFVYGFMSLDYGLGTMTTATYNSCASKRERKCILSQSNGAHMKIVLLSSPIVQHFLAGYSLNYKLFQKNVVFTKSSTRENIKYQ